MSKAPSRFGTGPLGLLTLLFVGLKLTGNIDWSWWWVLSPTLICIGLIVGILIVAGSIVTWAASNDR